MADSGVRQPHGNRAEREGSGVFLTFGAIPVMLVIGVLVVAALMWLPAQYTWLAFAIPIAIGIVAGGYYLARAADSDRNQ